MTDPSRTNQELLEEISVLKQRIKELEQLESGRALAEEALQVSEARYRQLFENAPAGIYEVDLTTGRLLSVNDALCEYTGYTKDELLTINALDLLTDESQKIFIERMAGYAVGEPVPSTLEYQARTKSGREFWISINPKYIYKEGIPVRASVVAHDITERKQAEKALQESELTFRSTFEQAAVGMAHVSLEGAWLRVNQRLCEIVGYTREELLQSSFQDITHPEDLDADLDFVRQLLDGQLETYTMEKRYIRKHGALVWVNLTVSLQHKASGEPGYFISVVDDITERKRASTFLKLVVNNIPDFVFWKDRQSVYIGCNDAFAKVAGVGSWENIIGKTDYDLKWKKEESDFFVTTDRKVMETNQAQYHIIEPQLQADGKQAWLETCKVPLHDEQGQVIGILGTYMDITERKRAEEEKEELQMQLNQAQKMEAIGQLAGGVAHDFNNMLNIILGYSQLALLKIEPSSPLNADLQEIMNATKRSSDLVRQLLAFARKQTIAPKALDLNHAVADTLKMLRKLIGEDIDLLWMPAANLLPVKMDPTQIDQLLANLAVNARDSISGVGKITIETGKAEFDEMYCSRHSGFVPGLYVMLAVSDNGCGMDKETCEKIFEPFFTTKEVGKGTGMGLATVYGIVKQNNGFVNVYSEPEKGTTFKIYLPRHGEDEAAIDETHVHAKPLTGTETVLLVEDNEALLKMSKIMLEELGYTVLAAGNPQEAIKLGGQYAGDIHLLVTDVVMPEMSGRDLQKRLSALRPDMKYLFMSGYTANVIAHRGILDEGVNFLQKPFLMDMLATKVREALE